MPSVFDLLDVLDLTIIYAMFDFQAIRPSNCRSDRPTCRFMKIPKVTRCSTFSMMDEERSGGVSYAEGNQNHLNPHGDAAMPLEDFIITVSF
jgi:hypothetical protein